MHETPGRNILTLSQNNWPETAQKLISSPWNPRLWATWQSSSPRLPYPCCCLPRHPFPKESLALSARVFPWIIYFWVLDKSPLSGPGIAPCHSCKNFNTLQTLLLLTKFFLEPYKYLKQIQLWPTLQVFTCKGQVESKGDNLNNLIFEFLTPFP